MPQRDEQEALLPVMPVLSNARCTRRHPGVTRQLEGRRRAQTRQNRPRGALAEACFILLASRGLCCCTWRDGSSTRNRRSAGCGGGVCVTSGGRTPACEGAEDGAVLGNNEQRLVPASTKHCCSQVHKMAVVRQETHSGFFRSLATICPALFDPSSYVEQG